MDTQMPFASANSSSKGGFAHGALCYKATLVTSSGLWLGNYPFDFSLPLLMTQILMFVSTSHIIHFFLKHLGQPMVISQIMAGIVFGPTFISSKNSFSKTMFPAESKMYLDTIAGMCLMLFLFMLGVKTDLLMLKKSGRKALTIGLASFVIPFAVMMIAGTALKYNVPPSFNENLFLLLLSSTWARTSYIVLACLLDELHLLNSKLGRLAMSGTLLQEFTNTITSSILTAIQLGLHASTPMNGFGSFVSFVAFLLFIVFIARPVVVWMVRRSPEGEPLNDTYFLVVIIITLTCGFIGELIGHHATMGAFFLGLALPGGPPLGATLDERLAGFIEWIGVPIFLAMAGYRTDLTTVIGSPEAFFLLFFIFICAMAKIVGVVVPCFFYRIPMRDAIILALILSTKGIFEIYVLNNWLDGQVVDKQLYSVIVICVVAFTAVTTPIVKAMYKPSMRYIAHKKRTIQHCKADSELRILACVRNEENVDPMIQILDTSQFTKDTPMCIYVLHVVRLLGQTATKLAPYKRGRWGSESQHIVNAFKCMERRNKDTVLVQPFVSVSPQATMHDDVCSLALEKKVTLVIIPFHKQMAIDGSMEAASHAYRTMNINVLDYAPCSVAILIDHGLSGPGAKFSCSLLHHIGVYFFGGPDDREALALAIRMVGNSTFPLTVVRFVVPKEWRCYTSEERLDDELIQDFKAKNAHRRNVTYREVVVKDGEETSTVIRTMVEFSLLLVGRRYGEESPMTSGLAMWSEYPELGLIGDMLASTGYGGKVSTLVVQQQTRVGMVRGDRVNCRQIARFYHNRLSKKSRHFSTKLGL